MRHWILSDIVNQTEKKCMQLFLYPVSHHVVSLMKEFQWCVKKVPYHYTHEFLWFFSGLRKS